MIEAWIVIREQRNADDRYWVCHEKYDALKIAIEVATYWKASCGADPEDLDEELYGDQVFHCNMEDCFDVSVQPQSIREAGEAGDTE